MFLNPDSSVSHALHLARTGLLGSIVAAVLAAGCASPSPKNADAAANSTAAAPAVALCHLPSPLPSPANLTATDAVARLLTYAGQVRLMPPAELAQEVTRLGNSTDPATQVQLSLVLSQLLQPPELIRAQELLGRVLADTSAEAQTLHPLAGLLASRYVELRRLADQLEKQNQQTREIQRRLDQSNERLDALKAIERSLPTRPPTASPSAPTRRGVHAPAP